MLMLLSPLTADALSCGKAQPYGAVRYGADALCQALSTEWSGSLRDHQ